MTIMIASLALLTLFVSLAISGILLMRRPGKRLIGSVLLGQAVLLLVLQVLLSTIPFGIGEPLIRVPFWETLRQVGVIIGTIAAAGALVYWALRGLGRLLNRARRPAVAASALLLVFPITAAAGLYGMTRWSLPERERERDPSKRQIQLESGFEWSIYAQGTMDNPTTIAFGPDNKLYIADIAGDLWVGTDTNNDFTIDSITRWATDFDLLVGLLWYDGELYSASSGKIEALRDSDGDNVADQRRLVVGDLPSMIFRPHSNNGLALKDGRIYFGVGSTTDGQFESNPLAAAILSVKPDGSDLKVFARGLGNSFDVAFNSDGELFAGDNGPSTDGSGGKPPDEFNHIVEGEHYGFPYFYGDPPDDGGTRGALVSFPPGSVPTGLTFYTGDTYPPAFKDNAFITLWGTGEVQRIEVARTGTGDYLSRLTPFGSGFLYPIDAITGPDGNLYIADFGTSAIYRITYDVNKAG